MKINCAVIQIKGQTVFDIDATENANKSVSNKKTHCFFHEQWGAGQVHGESGCQCSWDSDPDHQPEQTLHEARQVSHPPAGTWATCGGNGKLLSSWMAMSFFISCNIIFTDSLFFSCRRRIQITVTFSKQQLLLKILWYVTVLSYLPFNLSVCVATKAILTFDFSWFWPMWAVSCHGAKHFSLFSLIPSYPHV